MRATRWTAEQVAAQIRRVTAAVELPPPKITPKYRNEKTERDGIKYDSKKESKTLADLETLERAGHIKDLRRQVKFAIVIDGIHVCDYVADAVYQDGARRVVVDVKSAMTRKLPIYRLKKKLIAAVLGIQIEEM